ncbi:MAG: nucleoside hydrolase [Microbacterium sp.]|nr:MAG: nucleoside hydrolase [Microbacterium sp.]
MPRVLLDADTGVDDALAIAYLVDHPDVEIVGIACSAGNVSVDRVVANTAAVLDLLGAPEVPFAAGAASPLIGAMTAFADDVHGASGLGAADLPASARAIDPRTAAQLWIDTVRAEPGRIVGLVTGPLTNLALAIRLDPGIVDLLAGLVDMGGAFDHRGNVGGTAEWNIFVDPEAAKVVLDAFEGRPREQLPVLCGLNITERVALEPSHLAQLHETSGDTAITRFVDAALQPYFAYYENAGYGPQAPMHDPLAAVLAVDPSLALEVAPATVDVELQGRLTRGMTVADWAGEWARPANAVIVKEVDRAAVLGRLLASFARLSATHGGAARAGEI